MDELALHVLLLDDEASARESLAQNLRKKYSYVVSIAADGNEAMHMIEQAQGRYDIALIDESTAGEPNGFEVLQQIKSRFSEIEVIIITGLGVQSGLKALRAGAYRFFVKPFDLEELALTVRIAARQVQTRRQQKTLSAFQRISTVINSSLDLKEILGLTCKAVVELFSVDHSGLTLFDESLERGVVVAEYPEIGLGLAVPIRGILAEERLIATQQPLVVADVLNESSLGLVRNSLIALGIRSLVIVPVVNKGRVIGSFSLDAIKHPRKFTAEEIELCQVFASQVAVAIENARLYQDAIMGREYLESLYESSSIIISPRNPAEVLTSIVEIACRVTGAWRAAILLVDESGQSRILATSGFDSQLESPVSTRSNGISAKVLRSGEAYFIPDMEVASTEVHPITLEQGVKAAACLPLRVLGKIIGVLWIHFHEKHSFRETEMRALQVYTNQSAIAYDNARRLQELEQLRMAAESMASAAEPKEVLQQIIKSAKEVLEADYAVLWSYDPARGIFFPQELGAENVPPELLERIRKEEPTVGRMTHMVFREGYVSIGDLLHTDIVGVSTRELLNALGVRSFQGIRLEVAGELLGVLYVDYIKPRSFGIEDRRMLEHFANNAALTLKKARLLEQVIRSREAVRVIAKASTLGNLEDTLEAIVNGARDALGCDIVTLYTFDEDAQRFVQAKGVGLIDLRNMRSPEELMQHSAVKKIADFTQPYYQFSEVAQDDDLLKGDFVRAENIKSALGVQLRFGGNCVGVMFINYRTPHRFTEDEIENALQFGNQAAIAIRNAQLYSETGKRAEALAALYEAGRAIAGSLSLEDTLNHIAVQALRIVGSGQQQEGCFSHVALIEGDKLRFVAGSSPVIRDLQRSVEIGVDGRAVKTGVTQLVADVMQDPDYIILNDRIQSELSVPLKIDDQVIGVLSIEYPLSNAFTTEDVSNMELLASQAAIAIQNARQYEELKQTKGLVGSRTAVAWMGMVSSTWRHSVESNAITIQSLTELMRQDLSSSQDNAALRQRLNEKLTRVEQATQKIVAKPITPPLSSEDSVADVSINYLVRERVDQLWQAEPYRNIRHDLVLDASDNATVRVSPEWLRRALDIVVDNAAKAVASQLEAKITIGTTDTNEGIEISVSDTGRGIPPDVLPKLFLAPIPSQGALGIGLLLAQTILQTYGGDIRIESSGPQGTIVGIWLPKEPGEISSLVQPTIPKYTSPFDYERLYMEQKRANEELQELDRKKTEFLSTVSHELRTPLTPVKSCIENLLAGMYGPLAEKQKARLEIALASVGEETRLIQNLLDLARIQEGRVTLELEYGSVARVLYDISNVFQYDADQRNIILETEFPEGDALETLLDVGKIKQVVTNMASNALKFTPAGGTVTIIATRQDRQIEIRVSDTGIGIPETEFRRIFDRFYQVGNSLTRKVGGTGIGLSIAKEYVEMHGGRIWVDSILTKGSTFYFTLPVRSSEED